MEKLKRYLIKDSDHLFDITLEVDHLKLTFERAMDINRFWSGDDDRLDDDHGNAVRVVIKLAATQLMSAMLSIGGAYVPESNKEGAGSWTRDYLHNQKGWGGASEDGSPFGWCGIRLVSADVQLATSLDIFEV